VEPAVSQKVNERTRTPDFAAVLDELKFAKAAGSVSFLCGTTEAAFAFSEVSFEYWSVDWDNEANSFETSFGSVGCTTPGPLEIPFNSSSLRTGLFEGSTPAGSASTKFASTSPGSI